MLENKTINESGALPVDVFADLEATLEEVAESNPRINSTDTGSKHSEDLRAILEASLEIGRAHV